MEWLQCEVKQGQFTGEFAVRGKLYDSHQFSMFVPDKYIKIDTQPPENNYVDGLISVNLLDEKDNLALVSLPQNSFENGHTITVKRDQLQES